MGRVALAFLLGHCGIHGLERLPAAHWSFVLLAAALALTLPCKFRRGKFRRGKFRRGKFKPVASALAGLIAGSGWALLNAAGRTAGDLPPVLEGQDLLVRGYVASFPRDAAGDSQFLLDVVEPSGVAAHVRLVWYRAAHAPQAGELWQLVFADLSLQHHGGRLLRLRGPGHHFH